jgi:hypothetical protein
MFTDLEYVLMLAVVVLLWRAADTRRWAESEKRRANKYANWIIGVYQNKGKIVHKDDAYFFEENK